MISRGRHLTSTLRARRLLLAAYLTAINSSHHCVNELPVSSRDDPADHRTKRRSRSRCHTGLPRVRGWRANRCRICRALCRVTRATDRLPRFRSATTSAGCADAHRDRVPLPFNLRLLHCFQCHRLAAHSARSAQHHAPPHFTMTRTPSAPASRHAVGSSAARLVHSYGTRSTQPSTSCPPPTSRGQAAAGTHACRC